MTKESVHPCLREGKVLMEFEKMRYLSVFKGCRGFNAHNACSANRGRWTICGMTD